MFKDVCCRIGIWGKGLKQSGNEQFLCLPQCFQKLSAADVSNAPAYGKGLKLKNQIEGNGLNTLCFTKDVEVIN